MEQTVHAVPTSEDIGYMQEAIALAQAAARAGEVPVGAVLVAGGRIVGRGMNLREQGKDATLHAEMLAIRQACKTLGGWRLPQATLYVTLEPCPMCAGAILNARIDRLVYGAPDPKSGCCGSLLDLLASGACNHRTEVLSGVLQEECQELLRDFFRSRREKR